MMSSGFWDTFEKYLSQFRDEKREKEFREFLIALAEWRITQIVVTMLKEGITNFGPLTPNMLVYYLTDPPLSRKVFESERYNPNEWERRYYDAYQKLYYIYEQIALTFPKDKRDIFFMHDTPPTTLFEYLYKHFFPWEPDYISGQYEGKRLCRW